MFLAFVSRMENYSAVTVSEKMSHLNCARNEEVEHKLMEIKRLLVTQQVISAKLFLIRNSQATLLPWASRVSSFRCFQIIKARRKVCIWNLLVHFFPPSSKQKKKITFLMKCQFEVSLEKSDPLVSPGWFPGQSKLKDITANCASEYISVFFLRIQAQYDVSQKSTCQNSKNVKNKKESGLDLGVLVSLWYNSYHISS